MTIPWFSSTQLAGLIGEQDWRAPVYRDLSERIRMLVVDGQLPDGFRMPSERDLATTLGLSRTTVTNSYALLRELGVLIARRGAGNFIRQPVGSLASSLVPIPYSGDDDNDLVALNTASSTAPVGLSRAYQAAAEGLPSLLGGTGYFPDGVETLRAALAEWFSGRGLPTRADQMIITVGSLSGWNVILHALVSPGDPILLESPTYYNAIEAARRSGARLVPFPIGARDWNLQQLEMIVKRSQVRLAFLIPEFQNPTGVWLDEEQRRATADILNHNQVLTVVDETLVELILDGAEARTPMARLLDGAITIGSASKSFWGGLRIGWIRAPRQHVRRLIETQSSMDNGAAPFEQLVTAELMRQADDVLLYQRTRVRRQRDHLVDAMRTSLPDWEFAVPDGGLSLWFTMPRASSTLISALARRRGLLLTPGPRFYPRGGGRRQLRIPFVAEPHVLTEAVRRLVQVVEESESGVRPPSASAAAELII